MTLARTLRVLLGIAALLVIAWSFVHLGIRTVGGWQARSSDPRTELTVLHWGDNAENEIVQSLIGEFEAANPDIKINRIHAADYDAKLNTMFAAGAAPDLFYINFEKLPKLAGMGLLEPIDAYLAADAAAGDPWTADFFPVLMDAFKYDGERVGAGPQYGVPKDFTPLLFYVNLDLFKRAGIPVPYAGWSWDEFEAALSKISVLEDPTGTVYGAVLATWPGVLRDIFWSFGGDFFNGADFRDVTVDEPPAQAALEMIRRLRFEDDANGNRRVYNATHGNAQGLGEQEFYTGRVGAVGPIGRWRTPRFRDIQTFDWDVVPSPQQPGVQRDNAVACVAWAMSSQGEKKAEAYRLLKFLCGPTGQRLTAQSGLAVPCLRSVAESDDFLHPGQKPANAQLFVDLMDATRVGQLPQDSEFGRYLQEEVDQSIRLNNQTPADAARAAEDRWLTELDSPLRDPTFPAMPWRTVIGVAAAFAALAVGLLVFWLRREKLGAIDRAQERSGWMFIAPWILGFLLLTLGPMAVSLLLSLTRWTSMQPLDSAEFVGVANFTHLFTRDASFMKSLWVTFYYAALAVPILQIAAVLVAVLMNQPVRAIAIFRTIYFVPSVVSGVALATLWVMIFDPDKGVLNRMLNFVLGPFGLSAPDWFGTDAEVFAIPAFVMMALWGVGAGMVIYLAGLKGIPGSLYEAARIDGAGKVKQFFNITLPMLSPLIFFNLVMGLIGSFQVFTQVYVMTEGGPGNATLVYVLKLYLEAFEYHKMGYASAMAWILFLVLLGLTLLVVRSSKKWVHYEGLS